MVEIHGGFDLSEPSDVEWLADVLNKVFRYKQKESKSRHPQYFFKEEDGKLFSQEPPKKGWVEVRFDDDNIEWLNEQIALFKKHKKFM